MNTPEQHFGHERLTGSSIEPRLERGDIFMSEIEGNTEEPRETPEEQPGQQNRNRQDRDSRRGQNQNNRDNRPPSDSDDEDDDDEDKDQKDEKVSESDIDGIEKLEQIRKKGEVKAFVERFKKRAKNPLHDPFEGKDFNELQKEYLEILKWEKDQKADFGGYRDALVKKIRDKHGDKAHDFFVKATEYMDRRNAVKERKASTIKLDGEKGPGIKPIVEAAWRDKKLIDAQRAVGRILTSEEITEIRLTSEEQAKIDALEFPDPDYLRAESKAKVERQKTNLKDRKSVADKISEDIINELLRPVDSGRETERLNELKNALKTDAGRGIGSKLRSLMSIEIEGNKREDVDKEIKRVVDENGSSLTSLRRAIVGFASSEEAEEHRHDGLMGQVRAAREEKMRDFYRVPSSIQELSKLIMDREAEFSLYREAGGGEHPLIDPDTGEFRKDNFLHWIRKSAMYWHGFSPDDKIDLFNQVGIYTGQRQYQFGEMYKNDNYFTDSESGKVLTDFREKCMHELWLFTMSHNMDAVYRQSMGSDTELPKVIQQLYYNNTFTKNSSGKSTLEWLLKMPSYYRKPVMETQADGTVKEKKQLKETSNAGEALRRALLTYYYMTDYDMLRKIYNGKEVPLFAEKHFLYKDHKLIHKEIGHEGEYKFEDKIDPETDQKRRVLVRLIKSNDPDNPGQTKTTTEEIGEVSEDAEEIETDMYDPETGSTKRVKGFAVKGKGGRKGQGADDNVWNPEGDWFDENGKLREKGKWKDKKGEDRNGDMVKREFMMWNNIFNDVQRDLASVSAVREKLKQSLMAEHKISHQDADYIENWAFTMARWSGMAAKNDDGAVGFDAWTKVQNFEDYRMRQIQSRRGGMAGNIYNLGMIKRIGVDFFNGAITTDGKTILEMIQGGQGTEIDIRSDQELENSSNPEDKKKVISGFQFRDNTMSKFAEDHVTRCFGILNKLIESTEFSFDKVGVWDERQMRYIVDQEKLNKVVDGLQKEIRNAYSTFKQVDYGKKVRYYEKKYNPHPREGHRAQDELDFKETSIAEMLFGPQVMEEYKHKYDKSVEEKNKELRSGKITREEYEKWDKTANPGAEFAKDRNFAWREVLKNLITAEMTAHHHADSPYRQFTIGEVESFWHSLMAIPGGVEIDPNDHRKTRITRTFFDHHEEEEMRKKSKTSFWRMFIGELIWQTMAGTVTGTFKGAQDVAKETLKT